MTNSKAMAISIGGLLLYGSYFVARLVWGSNGLPLPFIYFYGVATGLVTLAVYIKLVKM